MFKIITSREDANQSHRTYYLRPPRMALIKKIISVKNVEKFEHSYTAGVNGKPVP